MRYAVVFEKAEENYAAYVPDLPGCIATGDTPAEVEQNIREAIAFHLAGMQEDGETPPPPLVWTAVIEVPTAGAA